MGLRVSMTSRQFWANVSSEEEFPDSWDIESIMSASEQWAWEWV
jgi:hypothetical protein